MCDRLLRFSCLWHPFPGQPEGWVVRLPSTMCNVDLLVTGIQLIHLAGQGAVETCNRNGGKETKFWNCGGKTRGLINKDQILL